MSIASLTNRKNQTTVNLLSRQLARLGGESPALLAQCGERTRLKASATGASLLVPVIIATGGSSYLLWLTSGHLPVAIVGSMLWGLIVLLIDLVLLRTLARSQNKPIGMLLRVSFAVVASAIFAHPLLLFAFQDAITLHLEEEREAALTRIDNKTEDRIEQLRSQQLPELENERTRLNRLREQGQPLQQSLAQIEIELQDWREKLDQEINGLRGSQTAGDGEIAAQIRQDYITPLTARSNDLRRDIADNRRDLVRAEQNLSRLLESADQTPEIAAARLERAQERKKVNAQSRNGILLRFDALYALKKDNRHIASAYWSLCLLLVLAELTPLVAKTLSPVDEADLLAWREHYRAQVDYESFCEQYPSYSASLQGEALRLEHEQTLLTNERSLAYDQLSSTRLFALHAFAEKDALFTVIDEHLEKAQKSGEPQQIRITQSLCARLLNDFERSLAPEKEEGERAA